MINSQFSEKPYWLPNCLYKIAQSWSQHKSSLSPLNICDGCKLGILVQLLTVRVGGTLCLFMEPFSSYRVSLSCLAMRICSWYCNLLGCVQWISPGSLLISEKKWMMGESEIKAGWGWWKELSEGKPQSGLLYEKKEYVKIKTKIRGLVLDPAWCLRKREDWRIYSIMHVEWNPNDKKHFVCFFLVFVSQWNLLLCTKTVIFHREKTLKICIWDASVISFHSFCLGVSALYSW